MPGTWYLKFSMIKFEASISCSSVHLRSAFFNFLIFFFFEVGGRGLTSLASVHTCSAFTTIHNKDYEEVLKLFPF